MECARVLVSTSLVAGITLGATTAFAEDDGLRLRWSAPAGCPSGDDVKSATLRGVDRERMLPGTLAADANVEQLGPTSWRVRLTTRRGDSAGEREIEGPTCSGVADATAVILALALVPPTIIEAPPPRPAPEEPPAKPAEPERPKATASRSHQLAAGASFAGNIGGLPKLGAGAAITLAWTPGRLRVEADGKYFGGQTASADGAPGSARFGLMGVGARGCFVVIDGSSFDVAPCLGFGVDLLSAEGRRTDNNASTTEVLGSFGGGGLARVHLASWLAIRARVEAVVPFSRPTFLVEENLDDRTNTGTVFQPPTIGAAGYFGAEVLFL